MEVTYSTVNPQTPIVTQHISLINRNDEDKMGLLQVVSHQVLEIEM